MGILDGAVVGIGSLFVIIAVGFWTLFWIEKTERKITHGQGSNRDNAHSNDKTS